MRDVKIDRIHQKETIFEISMSKIHIDFFSKVSFCKKNFKKFGRMVLTHDELLPKTPPKVAWVRTRDNTHLHKTVQELCMACMLKFLG